MPAENDPAEPKAETQSLQLTCSLMPSSTVPSTRLVIIWLKRCLARSLIEPALLSAPVVGVGVGDAVAVGVGVGVGVGDGLGVGEGLPEGDGVGVGVGFGVGSSQLVSQRACADAGDVVIGASKRKMPAVSAAGTTKLVMRCAMISARTACRWDRCRHRPE